MLLNLWIHQGFFIKLFGRCPSVEYSTTCEKQQPADALYWGLSVGLQFYFVGGGVFVCLVCGFFLFVLFVFWSLFVCFCICICLNHTKYWRGNFSQKVKVQPTALKICDLRHEAWMRLCCVMDSCSFYCKVEPRKEQGIRQLMLIRIADNKLHHSISLRDLVWLKWRILSFKTEVNFSRSLKIKLSKHCQ